MTTGFEANARVTANVSQFVQAAQEATVASRSFSRSVATLRTNLERMQQTARSAAAAIQPYDAAVQSGAANQRQAAQAARQLSQGLNTNAQAFQSSQQSAQNFNAAQGQTTDRLAQLAHQIRVTEERLRQVQRSMAQGADSSDAMQAASTQLTNQLRSLRQTFDTLNNSQRQNTQTSQMSQAALRAMGNEMARLAQQRRQLVALSHTQQGLDSAQALALSTLRERLRALTQQYVSLNAQQRATVDTARQLALAARQSSQAVQQLGQAARTSGSFIDHLANSVDASTGRLFALNAMLTDVEQGLTNMANVAQRAGTYLYETFSRQEMATAHLARVTQESDAYVGQLSDTIEELSERIPIPFEQLANIGVLGSQVGIADQYLSDFIETVALFAATNDIAEEEASLLFSRILEMTDLDASQIRQLASTVSELGSSASATEQEILVTTESIATVASQAGLSSTAILGLGSAMASLRIRPELARGSMQRVFLELRNAATEAGDGIGKLAEITGMTQDELTRLAETNPEEYFFRVLEGLGGLEDQGENLIPILREIGILNTRDADVVARLAGNYQFLEAQLDMANRSFAEGTFLQRESERMFDTLTARVQILGNTWQNFVADAFTAVAPFVTSLVEGATAALEFADSLGFVAPIVGWSALILGLVGTVALFGAGLTATIRSVVAMRNVLGTVSGAWATYTATSAAAAATTTATSAAMTTTAAATTATAAAGTRTVGIIGALSLAMSGLATAAARAATGLRVAAMAHPVTAVVTLTAALIGGVAAWDAFTSGASNSSEEILKAQEASQQAAGGMEALRTALHQDTEAWREARNAAAEHALQQGASADEAERAANRVGNAAALRVLSTEELTQAAKDERDELATTARNNLWFQESLQGNIEKLREQRDAMQGDTSVLDERIAKMESLQVTVEDNTQAVEQQNVAIGAATREWAAASLEAAFMETNVASSAEAMKVLRDTGVDVGGGLNAELMKAGDGAEYFRQKADEAREAAGFWDRFFGDVNILGIQLWRSETVAAAEDAGAALDAMAENVEASTLSITEARNAATLFGDETVMLTEELGVTASALATMNAETALMDVELEGLGITLQTLRDGLAGFIVPLDAWQAAQEEANQKVRDSNTAIAELAADADVNFGSFLANLEEMARAQQNWASNLLQLSSEGVPADVIAGLTEMGAEGQAIVQGLVDASARDVDRFVQLWRMGGGDVLDNFAIVYADFIAQSAQAGNEGGTEFAQDLLARVAEGEISMQEATDRMTDYAKREFDNADPTMEGTLDDTEALNTMVDLLEEIRDFQAEGNRTARVTPTVDSRSFLDSLANMRAWFRYTVSVLQSGSVFGRQAAHVPRRKDGGWVSGPGGPRDDRVPIMASDREFVVNARSAQQFGPLLEWINGQHSSGSAPILAPNFVPNDILTVPRRPLTSMGADMPDAFYRGRNSPSSSVHEKIVLNINNQYPQAEPTSTTVNRALQYAAALDGLG